jgi:hypothetical protein
MSSTKTCYLWEVQAFRSHGPAYEEYHEMFRCKWICKVDSNNYALECYRGLCECEKCSQFTTPELFQHFINFTGHYVRKESSTPKGTLIIKRN